jgi:pyruvate dehydrogenase (quinone)
VRKIASELLVERLIDWGIENVFGLPGDGINGIMEGFRRHKERIRFVLVHHEEAAAFMATAYAKITGRLGVCLATSGPGGIHLANGLYDAKLDHQPVLAITGMQSTTQLGTGYQQEVHLDRLFMDVAEYNAMVHVPVTIPTLVDIAVRTSLSRRGVSHITFPVDIQEADADMIPYHGGIPVARPPDTAPSYNPPRVHPTEADLARAAELLNQENKTVVLAGVGALDATDQLLALADTLAAPVVKTLPGKASAPDDHPLVIGGLGLLGTRPAEEAMEQAETLMMVGTNFPYTKYLPEKARVVQIETEPMRIGNRVPVDVPLVGDAKATLAALLLMVGRREDRSFLEDAQEAMGRWRADMVALETPDRAPIQPQYVAAVVDRLASDNAILSTDSGTITTWAARHFHIRGDRRFMLSANLASMAPGLPYTIAAQVAHPRRQCIAFVGDGGFAMLMAEFLTAARYGLPIKVIVINNSVLGQILWEQMVLGYPEFGVRWERPADFAPWAQACGGFGRRVERGEELEQTLREAFAHEGPALVDVVVNPDEPPMPPKVHYDEAKGFVESFLKGQPRRASIASTLFQDKIDQLRA